MLKPVLQRFMALVMRSPAQGSTTQVWLAAGADESSSDVRGQYIADRTIQSLPAFGKDAQTAARLWAESEERADFQFSV